MKKKLVYWCVCWALIFLAVPLSATATELPVGVAYRGHIQDRGDYPRDGSWVDSPEIIGTTGQSKRIEGFEIKLNEDLPMEMSIRYNVHVQNRGWLYDENDPTDWPRDGVYAGTRGESLRIEAVKIVLTDSAGKPVPGYSVQYRGHVQNLGDQPQAADIWLADGAQLGTVGSSLRLEALLVRVVKNNADLTAYNALVAKVDKLNEADFTAPSWTALQMALKEHAVTADRTQAEVDAAVAMIQAAYEGLTKKTGPTVYDKAGTYGPASGSQTIDGDVRIAADGVILQNLTITGDMLISEAVGNGTVTLNNVTVDGDTLVRGGGANSIHINGGRYSRIVMEKTASGAVRIVATGVDGLDVIIAEDASGETIILEGAFDSVEINAPNMTVTTQGNTTTIGKMTVGETGGSSTVTLNPGTTVSELVLDGKAAIKGQGNVVKAEVKADGAVFDKKPASYTVAPGVVIPPVFPTPSDGGGGYNSPAPVAVTGVSLDQANLSLGVSRTAQLNATVLPNNAANKTVTWTSSDDTIATVDATGKVTGKKEGQAAITVKTDDGNKTASCKVTVTTSFEVTQIADGTAVITGMNGSSKVILIPETIDGVTVSGIGDQAFYNSDMTSVTIPRTVKTIGSMAFYDCLDLTTVTFAADSSLTAIGAAAFVGIGAMNLTLPASLNTIGDRAFLGCSLLESISISGGVTAIPLEAFSECRALTTVTLPSGLTAIGMGAFNNCTKLTTVTIPKGVNTISSGAFGYEGGKEPSSRSYTFRGNAPTTLGAGAIPTTPKPTICYYANCSGFNAGDWSGCTKEFILTTPIQTGLEIANSGSPSVTVNWNTVAGATDYEVLYGDTSGSYPTTAIITADLTATITGLDSTKTYYFVIKARDADGESLLSNEMTADMSVAVIDPANIDANGVITAYTGPGGAVVIPEKVGGKTITGIGDNAFKGQTNVTAVTIPQTVTSIGVSAFEGCNKMTTLSFTGSPTLVSIGDKAFQGCKILESVSLPSSVKTIGAYGFLQCFALKDLNLGSVETIGEKAFSQCNSLASLTIPNSVKVINSSVFADCTGLKTVIFLGGENAQTLNGWVFSGCTALESVTFAADSKAVFNAWGLFNGCSKLNNVTLPPGLTKIPGYTFQACTALTSLRIPETVTTIEVSAFSGCPANLVLRFDGNAPGSVDSTAFPDGTTFAYWEDKTGFTGAPWTNSKYHLVLRNISLNQTDVTINTASFSFDAQDEATEVKLQKKIHTDSAWTDATTEALTSASTTAIATGLTPGTSYDFRLLVTGGDNDGPSRVVNLNTLVAVTEITLDKTTLDLSQNSSDTLTATVTPDNAINKNLNWTTSDANIATVDGNGLVMAKKPGTAEITATAADGGGAYASCTVTVLPYSFTVTDGKVTITGYLGSAATVSIPETIGGKPVVAIGKQAFYFNQTLTEVTIPASVTSIGEAAFHMCHNLTTVDFSPGSQLISIDLDGFSECPLTSLMLPSQLQIISNYSFYHNHLSGSLTIPATVTYIGDNAFEGKMNGATHLSSLETLTIQSTGGVNIRPSAFKFQPLTTITLPDGVSIGGDPATMGTNGTGFLAAYLAGGAGIYQYDSGSAAWSK
ncbi:leucine-rich repeat protein [Acetobacterium wieringae]|uniref:leucine-rich repeat protein n=1 Tax=Acetobacterium wieringae TaxID=52694 RepID=UPI0020347392|nr:leucine-rich repeat protein [Acetobacterium wieringae]URN82814.1 leucine-rich repeat protein [Acetobacterium wieringae]